MNALEETGAAMRGDGGGVKRRRDVEEDEEELLRPVKRVAGEVQIMTPDDPSALTTDGGDSMVFIRDSTDEEEASTLVADVLAPILRRNREDVLLALRESSVKAAMEDAGYLGDWDGGPVTVSPSEATALVALLRSERPRVRDTAVTVVRCLPRRTGNCEPLWRAGAVTQVVQLLAEGASTAAEAAIGLAMCSHCSIQLVEAGAVPHLLALLGSPDAVVADNALRALHNICMSEPGRARVIAGGGLQTLVALMDAELDVTKELATDVIRAVAGGGDHARAVAAAGALLPIVRLMQQGPDVVKALAAAAGANIARDRTLIPAVIEAGVLSETVTLLRTAPDYVRRQAAGLLAQLSLDAGACESLVGAGALEPVVAFLEQAARPPWRPTLAIHALLPRSTRDAVIATLALARSDAMGNARHAAARDLAQLPVELLCCVFEYAAAAETAGHGCSLVLANVGTVADHGAAIIAAGALPPLVAQLTFGTDAEKRAAASALWSVCGGPHERTVVEAGALGPLVALAQTGSERAQEKAVGALQAIAFGTDCHLAMIEAGVVRVLVDALSRGSTTTHIQSMAALGRLALNENLVPVLVAAGVAEALARVEARGGEEERAEAQSLLLLLRKPAAQERGDGLD